MATEPLAFREDCRISFTEHVRRDTAVDGRILMTTPVGRFVAIPPGAEPLLDQIKHGCSVSDLRHLIEPTARGEQRLDSFLLCLARAGVIEGGLQEPRPGGHLGDRLTKLSFIHVVIPVDADRVARTMARPLGRVNVSITLVVGLVLGVASCGVGFFVAWPARLSLTLPSTTGLVCIAIITILQLSFHELSHAAIMAALGLRVRAFGVGLLYLLVPVAYVDRTEAYSLRSRKALILISLAGPLFDALAIGVSGIAFYASPEAHRQFFVVLICLQFAVLAANCNPFFRSDGVHALEAALGIVNLRSRSFAVVNSLLRRRPSSALNAAPPLSTRLGYLAYALGSVMYLALLAISLIHIAENVLSEFAK